eukprot:2157570-Heterocapsa_arctica.AAC.1
MYVEPTTSMEMKVRIEELETKGEAAMCYATRRIQWITLYSCSKEDCYKCVIIPKSGGELRGPNRQRKNNR